MATHDIYLLSGIYNVPQTFFRPLIDYFPRSSLEPKEKFVFHCLTLPGRGHRFKKQAKMLNNRRIKDDLEYLEEVLTDVVSTRAIVSQGLEKQGKISLIAHSYGALLAMAFLDKHPGSKLFHRVVFLNPAMPRGIKNSTKLNTFLALPQARAIFKKRPTRRFNLATRMLTGHKAENIFYEAGGVLFDLAFRRPEIDTRNFPGKKIHIIQGRYDRIIPHQSINELVRKVIAPSYYFETGHYCFLGREGTRVVKKIYEILCQDS